MTNNMPMHVHLDKHTHAHGGADPHDREIIHNSRAVVHMNVVTDAAVSVIVALVS